MVKVFTYGTLMRGFGNYHVMEDAQGRFLTEAFIEGKDIYFAFQNGFPAVVDGKGRVYGEIFEVPEKYLERLDRLEGYRKDSPKGSMYLRKRAKATLPTGEQIWVSYYHWNRSVHPDLKITSGKYPRR